MITKAFNKSEIATRYFDKLRIPYKTRNEAGVRFGQLRKVNETVLDEVFQDVLTEQNSLIETFRSNSIVKFYKA
jgi:hypothetical protein